MSSRSNREADRLTEPAWDSGRKLSKKKDNSNSIEPCTTVHAETGVGNAKTKRAPLAEHPSGASQLPRMDQKAIDSEPTSWLSCFRSKRFLPPKMYCRPQVAPVLPIGLVTPTVK